MIYNKDSSRITLLIVFLIVFIDMLGIGVLIPVFPMLFAPDSHLKLADDSLILAGWLLAIFPIMQFFFSPFIGQLADRFGRKKILIISSLGTLISFIIFALGITVGSIVLLFIGRFLDGLSGSNIAISQAIISDVSDDRSRARNFGLIGAALGLGFIIGPFIGGELSGGVSSRWLNLATPFWFIVILCVINQIVIIRFLPETLAINKNSRLNIRRPIENLINVFRYKNLTILFITLFLFNSGFNFFTTFWGIILIDKFGYLQSDIGKFYMYIGILIVLIQGGFIRRLSNRIVDYKVLPYAILITGSSLLGFYFISPNYKFMLYIIPPFLALGMALTKAFSNALLTRIADKSSIAEVIGINSSGNALAQVIPPIVAGYVALYSINIIVLIGAIITLFAALLFVFGFVTKQT